MGYIFSQIILIIPPVLPYPFSEFINACFFDFLLENEQHFFRSFCPFYKNLINLVGVIKLGANFPNLFYPGIVERRNEEKKRSGV